MHQIDILTSLQALSACLHSSRHVCTQLDSSYSATASRSVYDICSPTKGRSTCISGEQPKHASGLPQQLKGSAQIMVSKLPGELSLSGLQMKRCKHGCRATNIVPLHHSARSCCSW